MTVVALPMHLWYLCFRASPEEGSDEHLSLSLASLVRSSLVRKYFARSLVKLSDLVSYKGLSPGAFQVPLCYRSLRSLTCCSTTSWTEKFVLTLLLLRSHAGPLFMSSLDCFLPMVLVSKGFISQSELMKLMFSLRHFNFFIISIGHNFFRYSWL